MPAKIYLFLVLNAAFLSATPPNQTISAKATKVWGPGLKPHLITMPARYFFIEARNINNERVNTEADHVFSVILEGVSKLQKPCRLWPNILNRRDGSFIVRYKLYEACNNFNIQIKYGNEHVAESPYLINGAIYPDDCDCPKGSSEEFLEKWGCGALPSQITRDLEPFTSVDWNDTRYKVIERFDQPNAVSLCHYVVKDNAVFRKCYGKYVGFKMFMDKVLLSLSRKYYLPDLEFFTNLGDWPLIDKRAEVLPVFSWCGSTETRDILMPTYDITESSLENMGRVMLDMLSVQGNTPQTWPQKIEKAFWRGRDSNQHRLDLIDISRDHPALFNVSLTNFFFFRDKQEQYGPKVDHISFFDFFHYKYQLAIDGTVAAYRFPYLLAGGSLVLKQASKYHEHFYSDLAPNTHFIPVEKDLSDLVAKVEWARQNDAAARQIARNALQFANANLLPQSIFCYHAHLFHEFRARITSTISVLEGMERVPQADNACSCEGTLKDEL